MNNSPYNKGDKGKVSSHIDERLEDEEIRRLGLSGDVRLFSAVLERNVISPPPFCPDREMDN
jgi:hypothetical protein